MSLASTLQNTLVFADENGVIQRVQIKQTTYSDIRSEGGHRQFITTRIEGHTLEVSRLVNTAAEAASPLTRQELVSLLRQASLTAEAAVAVLLDRPAQRVPILRRQTPSASSSVEEAGSAD